MTAIDALLALVLFSVVCTAWGRRGQMSGGGDVDPVENGKKVQGVAAAMAVTALGFAINLVKNC